MCHFPLPYSHLNAQLLQLIVTVLDLVVAFCGKMERQWLLLLLSSDM